MPVTYTNRKGQTYTLYQAETKMGKPRYYFGLKGKARLAEEMPAGFSISESVNGIVSLVKDRPSLILPEEVTAVQEALKQHTKGSTYRIATKHEHVEIYEPFGPDGKPFQNGGEWLCFFSEDWYPTWRPSSSASKASTAIRPRFGMVSQ